MRRIVDDTWNITYPPYLSANAKDMIARLLERRPARRIGAHLWTPVQCFSKAQLYENA